MSTKHKTIKDMLVQFKNKQKQSLWDKMLINMFK